MSNDDGGSRGSDYVGWKSWVDQTPFGQLSAGESAYFDSELRDVRVAPGGIRTSRKSVTVTAGFSRIAGSAGGGLRVQSWSQLLSRRARTPDSRFSPPIG